MTFWGMEIRHPQPRDLALAALCVVVFAIIGVVLVAIGMLRAESVWPMVLALSTGAILAAFGISVARHGLRAIVVIAVVGAVGFALFAR